MPVSNETLLSQIEGMKELLVGLRDRDIVGIYKQLETMNGRQRDLAGEIGENAGHIQTLRWRVGQVEDNLKVSINMRTLLMGGLSTIQSFAAYFFSK